MESALKVVILYIFLSAFLVDDGEALRVVGHTEEDFETVCRPKLVSIVLDLKM